MGLVGNMDLTDNMMLRSFRQGHTPFTNRKPSKQLATDVVENLEVVTRVSPLRYADCPVVMYRRFSLEERLRLHLPYC